MAVLHRALCTWFVCLIFLILLVLRLDERTRWSWFIVFIPMWLYDGFLIVYLTFEMITYCRAPGGPGGRWVNEHYHFSASEFGPHVSPNFNIRLSIAFVSQWRNMRQLLIGSFVFVFI